MWSAVFEVGVRAALAGGLMLLSSAGAAAAGDGAITASGAWARPTLGQSRTVAAYLTIRNTGTAPDRLTGLATGIAKSAEIHESRLEGDVMTMRRVEALELPAAGEAALAPGGLHVMLTGIMRPLKAGEHFALTLSFERHAPLVVDVLVALTPPPG